MPPEPGLPGTLQGGGNSFLCLQKQHVQACSFFWLSTCFKLQLLNAVTSATQHVLQNTTHHSDPIHVCLQKQGVKGNSFCWLPDLLTEPGPLKAFGKNGQRLIQLADRYLQMKPVARRARWDSMCMVRLLA